VNTSVTQFYLGYNGMDAADSAHLDELIARNNRLRQLFLFDARRMLLSLMCADECGVVWPYLLDGDDLEYVTQASNCFGNVESIRAEFSLVVEERRRRAVTAQRDVAADVIEF
jgi:hypothetical protein